MTNPEILAKPEVQEFLLKHENSDLSALVLSGKSVAGIPPSELVEQIKSRQKAKKKLPQWYQTQGIIYPPPISLEQASSEETAEYKAQILSAKGQRLIDLTGGMGIDCSYFARKMQHVIYVERQELLVTCFRHNTAQLGIHNCEFVHGDGVDYLSELNTNQYDVIFLDPARRDAARNKVIALNQCEPDVSLLWPTLLQKAPAVMIKLSPMLDIAHTIAALQNVSEVHVVAVDNECKELLFLLERGFVGEAVIHTVNMQKTGSQVFVFNREEERVATAELSSEGTFLYEPNVAMLKSGAFKVVAARMNLSKLHEHSHLYLSDQLIDEFPGKTYRIERSYPANKKTIKANLGALAVSIKSRNYPESAAMIRKKYRLRDGDERYVFFTTTRVNAKEQRMVYECVKA